MTISLALPHLLFVPGLGLSLALGGDVLVLSADLSHDAVHVQVAAVVHLDNNGSVLDLALELTQLLRIQKNKNVLARARSSSDDWVKIFLCLVKVRSCADTNRFVDGPEEVDLILKSVSPGLQLHLVHVGSINILERA